MAKVKVVSAPSTKKVKVSGYSAGAWPPWFNQAVPSIHPDQVAAPKFSVAKTLKSVPREESNIEAEHGETVMMPSKGGLPAHYNIDGNRHYNGGTPLNVPKDSFVFSDTKKMRIKDEKILQMFGKSAGSWTPAELAKKYDINKYRKILQDPDSDDIMRSTAEKMIANYNLKLGKLALVQESKKGFPQGIPAVSMPYLSTYNINPDSVLPLKSDTEDIGYEEVPQAMYGLIIKSQYGATLPAIGTGLTVPTYRAPKPAGKAVPYIPPITTHDPYVNRAMQELNPSYSWVYQTLDPAPKDTLEWNWGIPQYIPAPATPVDTTKFYEAELTAEEKAALGLKYGGYYRPGGAVKTKLTPEQYAKLMKMRSVKKRSSYVSRQNAADIPAYGQQETALLKSLQEDIDLADLTVPGMQTGQGKKGLYGTFDPSQADKNWEWYGKKIDWRDPKSVGEAQKAYNEEIKNRAIKAGYSQDEADALVEHIGFVDKPGLPNSLDQKAGKFTETRKIFNIKPREKVKVSSEAKPAVIEEGPKRSYEPQFTRERGDAPWWIQDVINTWGAAGDYAKIKKYLPWAPHMQPYVPTPTFYDPTRELAANAEQMNIGTQGAGLFAGPQAYNARFSQIQGQGAKNAANILSRYHNQNVGVANQFDNIRSGIYNRANQINADSARKLYDQTTIANQQYDNAKREARAELRTQYTNALTNRAMAQTLNTLYPHYQVDPMTGGFTHFYKGSEMRPEAQNAMEDQLANIADLVGAYPYIDQNIIAGLVGIKSRKGPQLTDEEDWLSNYMNAFPTTRMNQMGPGY